MPAAADDRGTRRRGEARHGLSIRPGRVRLLRACRGRLRLAGGWPAHSRRRDLGQRDGRRGGHVQRADPARLRDVGDRVGGRQQAGRAAPVLVAQGQADVAVQRRLMQRHRAAGQLDRHHGQPGRPGRGHPGRRVGQLRPRQVAAGAQRGLAGRGMVGRGSVAAQPQLVDAECGRRPDDRPTLNGCPTDSSSSPIRPWVRRRQDRFSRFTSVAPSCRGPAGAPAPEFPLLVIAGPIIRRGRPADPQHPVPGAGRHPVSRPARRPPASAAASPSPGCAAPPGRRRRREPAGPARRRAAHAGPPCRSGSAGWTRSARSAAGRAGSPGGRQRTCSSPAAAALRRHRSSARRFTSVAHTAAPGARLARVSASGP